MSIFRKVFLSLYEGQRPIFGPYDYWKQLTGTDFEWEVADLYDRLDYDVQLTPRMDKGIDLILQKQGKLTIVQCKLTNKRADPDTVTLLYANLITPPVDLYPILHEHPPDEAILVCPAGFTSGAKVEARRKGIQLVEGRDLIKLESSTEHSVGGITVRFDPDTSEKLRYIASQEGTVTSILARTWINELLRQIEGRP